jgi:hypothetical protein
MHLSYVRKRIISNNICKYSYEIFKGRIFFSLHYFLPWNVYQWLQLWLLGVESVHRMGSLALVPDLGEHRPGSTQGWLHAAPALTLHIIFIAQCNQVQFHASRAAAKLHSHYFSSRQNSLTRYYVTFVKWKLIIEFIIIDTIMLQACYAIIRNVFFYVRQLGLNTKKKRF